MYGPKQRIFRCLAGTYNVAQILGVWQVTCTIRTNEVVVAAQDANDGNTYKVTSGIYKDWYLYETSTAGISHIGTLFTVNPARVPLEDYWYEVRGPTIACTLGQACTTLLEGYGLQNTNAVYIITSSKDCGDTTATPSEMIGLTNPRTVSDDDYDNQYRLGIVTVGGSYVACNVDDPSNTCIGDHYKLCWSANPTDVSAYNVQVGIFEMKGPFVDYSADCTIGSYCTFSIFGTGFQDSNRLLLIKSSASCGSDSMEIASFDGFVNPQQAKSDVTGKRADYTFGISTSGDEVSYRMCWGFSPIETEQNNIDVGPFSFATPPPNCKVLNKFAGSGDPQDVVCDEDVKTGFMGDEFNDVISYYEDNEGPSGGIGYKLGGGPL